MGLQLTLCLGFKRSPTKPSSWQVGFNVHDSGKVEVSFAEVGQTRASDLFSFVNGGRDGSWSTYSIFFIVCDWDLSYLFVTNLLWCCFRVQYVVFWICFYVGLGWPMGFGFLCVFQLAWPLFLWKLMFILDASIQSRKVQLVVGIIQFKFLSFRFWTKSV